jgi:TolA-binding protein
LLAEKRFEEAETACEELRIHLSDRPATSAKIIAKPVRGQLTEIAAARYCAAAAMVGLQKHQLAIALLGSVDMQLLPADMGHDFFQTKCAALQGLGRHAEAVTLLQQHVRGHAPGPELSRCRSQLILSFAEAGRWNDALAELQAFRKSDKEDPAVPQIALVLAEKAYFAGEISLAATIYERLISFNDHANIVAQATAGLAWSKSINDPAKGENKAFDQLLERYPDSPLAPQAIMLRAMELERRKEQQQAIHLYELLLERYPRTAQAPDALLAAGRLCSELNSQRDAVELLRRLTVEYPRYTHTDAALYLWGWALIDLGHPEAAEQLLQRLVAEFPRSRYWADASQTLAERAIERHDLAAAKQYLDRLLLVDTEPSLRIESLLLRGKIAAGEKKWGEVTQYMNQVVEQQGNQSQRTTAEFWLAESDYRRGDYHAAARRWTRLEGEAGGRRDDWSSLVSLRRAQTLAQLKKWEEAFELASALDHETEQFAEQHELDLLLARCNLQKEKYEEARSVLARILENDPPADPELTAMASWMIGESWFREKRYLEAVTAYLKGYEKYPNPRWQAACLLQAGKCYEVLDEWAKACEAYGVLIEEYGQSPYVVEARNRLSAANERSAERPTTTKNK